MQQQLSGEEHEMQVRSWPFVSLPSTPQTRRLWSFRAVFSRHRRAWLGAARVHVVPAPCSVGRAWGRARVHCAEGLRFCLFLGTSVGLLGLTRRARASSSGLSLRPGAQTLCSFKEESRFSKREMPSSTDFIRGHFWKETPSFLLEEGLLSRGQ